MRRSFHFMPGDKPHYFEKAGSLNADWYIFDLEDAVSDENKDNARETVFNYLRKNDLKNYFIRINSENTIHFEKDIEMVKQLSIKNVVIPKAESKQMMYDLLSMINPDKIIILIESFIGLGIIHELVEFNIYGLGLGLEDMLSEIPFNNNDLEHLIASIKSDFILKCHKNKFLPIDGIARNIYDTENFREECRLARSSGFMGKFSVHPLHIPMINEAFYPDKETIKWAEHIRSETGFINSGYMKTPSGEIITPPKIQKAKKILDTIKGELNDK